MKGQFAMKITIYSGELTKSEARGVIALLMEIHGADVVPASFERVGEIMRATGPVRIDITNQVSDTPAADGFPIDPGDEANAPFVPPAPLGGVVGSTLDSAGIPWDERIHSSTKGTNKDGTWSRRRNTPDELFASVMAELKAGATVIPPLPPEQAEPTAADAFSAPAIPAPPTTAAVIPPPPPATPTAPATGGAPTFVQLMTVVTGAQREGKLDKAKLDELLASCGIAGLGKLATADEGTRAAFDAVLTAALT